MAETGGTPWAVALERALGANEGTDRPTSLNQLYERLARSKGSTQTAASWKSTIKRIRKENTASEDQAALIAHALGQPRESFPPRAEKVTMQVLGRRLEELAELVGRGFLALGVTQEQLRPPADSPGLADER